jgi:hypothetical protein
MNIYYSSCCIVQGWNDPNAPSLDSMIEAINEVEEIGSEYVPFRYGKVRRLTEWDHFHWVLTCEFVVDLVHDLSKDTKTK